MARGILEGICDDAIAKAFSDLWAVERVTAPVVDLG